MEAKQTPFTHRYFASYAIDDPRAALWFSKRTTYEILELLWKAGPKGLTLSQVVQMLKETDKSVSASKVYATLKDFYESDIVDREWDNELKAHRNILRRQLLPAILDDDYEAWISDNLDDFMERSLFPQLSSFLTEVMRLIKDKKVPPDFLPRQGKFGWCDRCHTSHEAYFFFLGLLYYAAYNFVGLDWSFKDPDIGKQIASLYIDNRFADPEHPPEVSRHEKQ